MEVDCPECSQTLDKRGLWSHLARTHEIDKEDANRIVENFGEDSASTYIVGTVAIVLLYVLLGDMDDPIKEELNDIIW